MPMRQKRIFESIKNNRNLPLRSKSHRHHLRFVFIDSNLG